MIRWRTVVASIVVTILFASHAVRTSGYSSVSKPSAQLRFEVVSVKAAQDGSRGMDVKFLPGRVVATYQTLQQLISQAYGIQLHEITGGPGWMQSDRFEISATTDEVVGRDREMQMLQSLLADYFQLRMEKVVTRGTVYYLNTVKPHNLNPPKVPNERPFLAFGFDEKDGKRKWHYEGHNVTLAVFAARLSRQFQAPVIDRTHLTSSYDFVLEFDLDDPHEDAPDEIGTLFSAMRSQLGLKLTSGKGPVTRYVVREASKPPGIE